MSKINEKWRYVLAGFLVSLVLSWPVVSWAVDASKYGAETTARVGLISTEINLGGAIGNIIGNILSFIGVIFFVLMVFGGFMWMTARGNEEQTKKALNTITAAVIGLVIILSSYAITNVVFKNLSPAATGQGTSSSGAGKSCFIKDYDDYCVQFDNFSDKCSSSQYCTWDSTNKKCKTSALGSQFKGTLSPICKSNKNQSTCEANTGCYWGYEKSCLYIESEDSLLEGYCKYINNNGGSDACVEEVSWDVEVSLPNGKTGTETRKQSVCTYSESIKACHSKVSGTDLHYLVEAIKDKKATSIIDLDVFSDSCSGNEDKTTCVANFYCEWKEDENKANKPDTCKANSDCGANQY